MHISYKMTGRIEFIILILIPCVLGECRNGWVKYNDSCYFFSRFVAEWSVAEFDCENIFGGYLAEVGSQHESVFLRNYLQHEYEHDPHKNSTNYWIGGSDMEVEGEYMWMKSQQYFGFADWIPGQPDNAGQHEDCVHMWGRRDFKWNDMPCDQKAYFVCEMPVIPDRNEILG